MKKFFSAVAVFSLVSFSVGSADAKPKRIKTQAEYTQLVVGKTLRQGENTWFKGNANGTMTGMHNGEKFSGNWQWHKNFVCRNGAFAGKDPIGTDCQVVRIEGNQLYITRNKGKGKTVVYTLD